MKLLIKLLFLLDMDKLNPVFKKKWWKSKTVWAAVASLGVGVAEVLGYPLPPGVLAALTALGLLSARTSTRPLGK